MYISQNNNYKPVWLSMQSAYLEVNPTVVMSVTKGNIFEFLSDMT